MSNVVWLAVVISRSASHACARSRPSRPSSSVSFIPDETTAYGGGYKRTYQLMLPEYDPPVCFGGRPSLLGRMPEDSDDPERAAVRPPFRSCPRRQPAEEVLLVAAVGRDAADEKDARLGGAEGVFLSRGNGRRWRGRGGAAGREGRWLGWRAGRGHAVRWPRNERRDRESRLRVAERGGRVGLRRG